MRLFSEEIIAGADCLSILATIHMFNCLSMFASSMIFTVTDLVFEEVFRNEKNLNP